MELDILLWNNASNEIIKKIKQQLIITRMVKKA